MSRAVKVCSSEEAMAQTELHQYKWYVLSVCQVGHGTFSLDERKVRGVRAGNAEGEPGGRDHVAEAATSASSPDNAVV
jgi:hypothetical protein